jgi:polyribonucleotide nucleotidyltransferase
MEKDKMKKSIIKSEVDFNGEKITLESGKLAHLADSAVVATLGETTVLVTVVSKPTADITDFFPLRIEYEERFYAGGTIGGSRFTRREGKPTDDAIVSGRLIDHAVRPLFPKDFMDDTQIVVTVLAYDEIHDPALLGFLGVSAALQMAGVPFKGPIVPARILKKDGQTTYSLNKDLNESDMDIVVSYLNNGDKVQSIEAHADIIPEAEVIEAILAGKESVKPIFELLNDFASKNGVTAKPYEKSWLNKDAISKYSEEIIAEVNKWADSGLFYAEKEWGVKQLTLAKSLSEKDKEELSVTQFMAIIGEVQKDWVRDMVLKQNKRIDGRAFDEIRPLSAEVGLLPRVHGSAVFARGLTQALTITTLASPSKKLLVQEMIEEKLKRYIHHYNFPPYSTGEVGRIGATNRREIGHGMLAEKALVPVLPAEEDFPYALRVVTEIMTSNGSTSMAATCGSTLSLMDAGVPIKAPVAGIGVGLFVDSHIEDPKVEEFIVLTDIVGYEDFAGYMDFKMTGTNSGVTAIQMELKLQGIPVGLLNKIFETSKTARLKVLEVMTQAISEPRAELSKYAPKVEMVVIQKDQIGQVIGSGGVVIKALMEEYEVEIDIEEKDDQGFVAVSSPSRENIKAAVKAINDLFAEAEIGEVYEGKVTRVEPYGAFIEILPKKLALLHVSEYSYDFVSDMTSVVKVGDTLKVKVIGNEEGKISATKKALDPKPEGYEERERPQNTGGNRSGGFNRPNNRFNNRGGNRRF